MSTYSGSNHLQNSKSKKFGEKNVFSYIWQKPDMCVHLMIDSWLAGVCKHCWKYTRTWSKNKVIYWKYVFLYSGPKLSYNVSWVENNNDDNNFIQDEELGDFL